MLPAELQDLLSDQVTTDLQLAPSWREMQQKAIGAAFIGNTLQPGRYAAGLAESISTRAGLVSAGIHKVLEQVPVDPYEGLIADLLQFFELRFDEVVSQDLERAFDSLKRTNHEIDYHGFFAEKKSKWRAEGKMDVKRLATALMKKKSPNGGVTFTFHNSPVGAIQTGDGASLGSATVLQNPDIAPLLAALAQFRRELPSFSGFDETHKDELKEIASRAETELAKTQPNKTMVGGYLSVILTSIKGLAAAKEIYDLIAEHLPALGLTVS